MPANTSPTKQRAALAPLDPNANASLPSPKIVRDGKASVISSTGGSSPLKKRVVPATWSGTKRPAEDTGLPAKKKTCVEENARLRCSRTSSPSTSSVFDTSATEGDDSWATTTTEPDRAGAGAGASVSHAPALMVPRPRGNMTREQAREKAEILRLRLGLASYKLRTGQTGVPLADLQRRPLPPRSSVRLQSSSHHTPDVTGKNEDTKSQDSNASSMSISGTRLTNPNRPVPGRDVNKAPESS
ncbi:hypothetical protein E4U42_002574 [Claviceps africana]|uniref:Cyclin-dependent kinase n=1 Tax=Claviceps africana TaxID=83212 RepID=A0A8K0J811_9HYPO|nr:hypothetical protein E4U42_002574 [Claviceps africana]